MLFLQKNAKFLSAGGKWAKFRPQAPSLWRLGALPPDPHWPPAARGSAPKQPPHCEFLATRLAIIQYSRPNLIPINYQLAYQ